MASKTQLYYTLYDLQNFDMVYDLYSVKSLVIQLTSPGISNKDVHGSNSLFPN